MAGARRLRWRQPFRWRTKRDERPAGKATIDTSTVTSFWRQHVGGHYGRPVAKGDGRSCAQQLASKWICTAYVGKPNVDTDVYGTVTVSSGSMTVEAHLNRGRQITSWFLKTNGGCQTNSCTGTKFP